MEVKAAMTNLESRKTEFSNASPNQFPVSEEGKSILSN